MIVGDVPIRGQRRGAQLRSDTGQAGEWPDYFDDVVEVTSPPAYRRDSRYGYATGLSADPGARGGAAGRHAARPGRPRGNSQNLLPPLTGAASAPDRAERGARGTRSHAGVVALTAAAFVGTGIGAGVVGFAPSAHHAALPAVAAVPVAGTVPGSGSSVQHHPGYLGKHRRPAQAGLAAHPRTSAAAARSAAPAPMASPSSAAAPAGGSRQPASPSSGGTGSAPGTGQRPAPVSPSPSSTPRSPASSGTPAGSGTGGRHASGGQGLVGGLVGGVTGLLGSLGL
jgi:hypothetical protein